MRRRVGDDIDFAAAPLREHTAHPLREPSASGLTTPVGSVPGVVEYNYFHFTFTDHWAEQQGRDAPTLPRGHALSAQNESVKSRTTPRLCRRSPPYNHSHVYPCFWATYLAFL